jgi:hypothetical protein
MGAGIRGAILLEFEVETTYMQRFVSNSVKGFLDNYEVQPTGERSYYERYVIKNDILLPNYAGFLAEFYGIVHDEFKGICAPFGKESVSDYTEKLLSCKTREEFDDAFDKGNRNSGIPFGDRMSRSFSCLYCDKNAPFIFYGGSYKAFLEEYSSLVHMEKILVKAMDNPLKTAVKFGISG